ncbi:MAG: flippase [Bacteroidetes bacterium]|nr:flippase [Bacteroidota bacterium]
MGELANIKKNSFYFFISSVSRLFTNAIIFILIARFYGVDDFGSFSTAHTLSTLFLLLADFGFDILITTEIARNKNLALEITQKYFPIKVIFTTSALFLLWATLALIPASTESKTLIFIFSINMVLTTLLNMIYSVFKGVEQFQYEAKISSSINFILLIIVLWFSFYNLDIKFIALSIVLIRLIGLVLGIVIFKSNFQRITFEFNLKKIFSEMRIVMIFGIHLIFGTVFFQIDSVLLMTLKGDTEAGLYQAVFKLMVISLMLPEVLIGAVLPTITRLFSTNDPNWEKLGKFIYKLLFITGLPICLLFYLYPDFILTTIYNRSEYLESTMVLQFAGFIVFTRFIFEPSAMMLTVNNKQYIRTIIVIIAASFNVLFNILLIPIYGMKACIIISLVTNLIAGFLYLIFTRKLVISWMFDAKLLVPTLIVLSYLYLSNFLLSLPTAVQIASFLLFYSIPVLILNFSSEEKKMLFDINGNYFGKRNG